MGRLDFRPARVKHTVSMLLAAKKSASSPPAWYQTVGNIPPPETVTRTIPVQHRNAAAPNRRRVRKASKLFAPQQITYEEDSLRSEFFKDHPWELARPRLVLEDDGKDYQMWDWSKAHQPGRPIDGESVIQRQRHLMGEFVGPLTETALKTLGGGASRAERNRALDKACQQARDRAYDQARREFYSMRHDLEVETRVAREEALAVGATFGKTTLEVGMELENKTFDQWRAWAEEQATVLEQGRASAYGGTGQGAATLVDESSVESVPKDAAAD